MAEGDPELLARRSVFTNFTRNIASSLLTEEETVETPASGR
jgi:hypothetical protein